jgi:hypothetical protein
MEYPNNAPRGKRKKSNGMTALASECSKERAWQK